MLFLYNEAREQGLQAPYILSCYYSILQEVYLVSSAFREVNRMKVATGKQLLEKYIMKYIAFFRFMNYTTSRLDQQ